MIRLTQKEVMECATVVISRQPSDWSDIEVIGTCGGVQVLYDPVWVHATGMIMAITAKMMRLEGTCPVIVVDNFLRDAPKSVFDFFVAHEEGHIKHGDLDKVDAFNTLKRVVLSKLGYVQTIELEADAYAAETVGYDNAIKSLEWMLDNVPWKDTKKELRGRLRALKKLQRA